jgi:pimeloyl-ACP methyl ester carboxylesterase
MENNKKNIVIVSGLGSKIDIWKTTKTNQKSVYSYLEEKHNIFDLSIPIELFEFDIENLLKYMNNIIPKDSYLLANSFGCVTSILFTKKYPDKIKGIMLIDPTTEMESYRFKKFSTIISNNLINYLNFQYKIRYLTCPVISHVIIPFKKLTNSEKKVTNDHVFNILNDKFTYLKLLSNHPKSNIIIHPNLSHHIHQFECEKIKCNIDYLILD